MQYHSVKVYFNISSGTLLIFGNTDVDLQNIFLYCSISLVVALGTRTQFSGWVFSLLASKFHHFYVRKPVCPLISLIFLLEAPKFLLLSFASAFLKMQLFEQQRERHREEVPSLLVRSVTAGPTGLKLHISHMRAGTQPSEPSPAAFHSIH